MAVVLLNIVMLNRTCDCNTGFHSRDDVLTNNDILNASKNVIVESASSKTLTSAIIILNSERKGYDTILSDESLSIKESPIQTMIPFAPDSSTASETLKKVEMPSNIKIIPTKLNDSKKKYISIKPEIAQSEALNSIRISPTIKSEPTIIDYSTKKEIPTSLEGIHNLIVNQINYLQEVGDCESKKVLLCRNIDNFAGFGSMVHRYGVCMQVGYALGRMVLIDQPQYAHFGGMFKWLKEDSEKCSYLKAKYFDDNFKDKCNMQVKECYLENGYDIDDSPKILELTTEARFPAPRRVPGSIPPMLENALLKLDIVCPDVWFISQFLGYLLLRPNEQFAQQISDLKSRIGYDNTFLAFHIRHGDKISTGEAKYINETRYIEAANVYVYQEKLKEKNVYLATDDVLVNNLLKIYGPDFNIVGLPADYLNKSVVSYLSPKFPPEVIESTLMDLHFMTYSKFLICDSSSNLARVAYELKQTLPPYKQNGLVNSLGAQDFGYQWYGYGYWPNAQTMYVSINGNMQNITFKRGQYDLLSYKKGELFTGATFFDTGTKNATIAVRDIYGARPPKIGLVYQDDLVKWPGKPKYKLMD